MALSLLGNMGASVDQGSGVAIDGILKNYYLGPVVEQLSNEVYLLSRIEPSAEGLFGRQVILPLHTGRSTGIGARAEGQLLPDPGAQSYATLTYKLKYLYGRLRVTGPAMVKSEKEIGSFLQALKSELDGLKNDLRRDLARQVYGLAYDAPIGAVAKVASSADATHLTFTSDEPLRKGWLYPGMTIDVGSGTNPNLRATQVTIASIDIPSKTAVVSTMSPGSAASGDYVFRFGAAGNNSTYNASEVTGLQKLVSTTALASGDAGLVGQADTASIASGGYFDNIRQGSIGALSQDVLMQNFNKVRIAGGETSVMLTTFGVQRAFFNLLQSQVRYTEPQTLKGGFQTLEFQGKPFVADVDAPYGQIALLDERYVKVFSAGDWQFLNQDNDTIRWTQNYDAWEATLYRYMQLGITRRNVQCVLSGVTDPGY